MKHIYLIFALLFFSLTAQSQIDSQENSITIAVEENENSDTTTKVPIIESPNSTIGLSNTNENTLNGISVTKIDTEFNKEEEFSMVYKSDLINPGTIFEKKWAKEKRDNAVKPEYLGNQHLGDFKSNGKFVTIVCRDHEYPDGDRVRIYANDDIVRPSILLTTSYKSFKLDLLPGINKIDFQALNQGESGPNTAELIVYDDKGIIVSSNEWNLATGAKATIIIVKE
jgi:hypothetical protein